MSELAMSPALPRAVAPTTRRTFVRTAALLVGGALTGSAACAPQGASHGASQGAAQGGAPADAAPDASDSASRSRTGAAPRAVGLQLYTVRELMARDARGTLAALAGIGYTEIEPHDFYGHGAARFREFLDAAKLTSPSGHRSWADLRAQLDAVLDDAVTLGQRHVVLPWIEERDRTPEGYRRLVADCNRFGRACRERGLRFAYHNHDFEFDPKVVAGTTPYDLLLAETDPALVTFELDLFWATKAGRDPIALFDAHPGRFPLWHVKDMRDVRGAQEMVAVGAGEIDFGRIFAAARQSGMEHFFAEHDNPTDALATVRASHDHLRRLLR